MSSAGEPQLPDPYEIVSIRSVVAPSGMTGMDWHRYEISQGSNRIVGYRPGAADSVQEAVELIVLHLNMRRMASRGRVHVVLQSKASRDWRGKYA
jgi:hypothetical protein